LPAPTQQSYIFYTAIIFSDNFSRHCSVDKSILRIDNICVGCVIHAPHKQTGIP